MSELAYILDINEFTRKNQYDAKNNQKDRRKMTLFHAVVHELYPQLVGSKFFEKVDQCLQKWGRPTFTLDDAKEFHDSFSCLLLRI